MNEMMDVMCFKIIQGHAVIIEKGLVISWLMGH